MSEFFNKLKKSGWAQFTFAGVAIGAALFGAWPVFWASLGIFIYVNANVIWKSILDIKI